MRRRFARLPVHQRAVVAMILAALLWSMAGVVTRHLHRHDGMVLVFWRSGFAGLTLLLMLLARSGGRGLVVQMRAAGLSLWVSALCWGTMYTAFMLSLSMTTVAQTLIASSLGPLFAALLGRALLGQGVAPRTWGAIALSMCGVVWMVWRNAHSSMGPRELAGFGIGLLVPLAMAGNWVLLRRSGVDVPLQAAPMLGGLLSALAVAVAAWPATIDGHDLFWLAVLGTFQLTVPALLAVWAAQRLAPAEVALLGMLEEVFGTLWAWLGAGETPSSSTLFGGALILMALAGNELLGWWQQRRAAQAAVAASAEPRATSS